MLDGHDLREYTLSSLRDQVALVSQNVHLFNDTVANNIAYARTEEYSREQIEEAARMAYAMDFINKMDNGLDTIIGENGVMLSGGQRQRIAIARNCIRCSSAHDCAHLVRRIAFMAATASALLALWPGERINTAKL